MKGQTAIGRGRLTGWKRSTRFLLTEDNRIGLLERGKQVGGGRNLCYFSRFVWNFYWVQRIVEIVSWNVVFFPAIWFVKHFIYLWRNRSISLHWEIAMKAHVRLCRALYETKNGSFTLLAEGKARFAGSSFLTFCRSVLRSVKSTQRGRVRRHFPSYLWLYLFSFAYTLRYNFPLYLFVLVFILRARLLSAWKSNI